MPRAAPIGRDQLEQYRADGFLIFDRLFTQEEVDLMLEVARHDPLMMGPPSKLDKVKEQIEAVGRGGGVTFSMKDGAGNESKLWISSMLGDDIFGAAARCHRIVDTMEALMGEPVVYYHHKVMLKEPRVGGAWEWHQDYGYWYVEGCLFPQMASCMIALDRATRENGCLQIIRGSQRLGRIEHGGQGEQAGANMERVNAALELLEHRYVELAPGDALFFDANLLHRSDANRSEQSRWTFISAYSALSNVFLPDTVAASRIGAQAVEKWPDESILEFGRKRLAALE